jgi:hypothetical protein
MTLDEKTVAALMKLMDKQEIHDVLMRYCRGIDRCDEELLRSVYHPEKDARVMKRGSSRQWQSMLLVG